MKAIPKPLVVLFFVVVSLNLAAQGHRGDNEPPLNNSLMELPAIGGGTDYESTIRLAENSFYRSRREQLKRCWRK